jgi:hypothetical protein
LVSTINGLSPSGGSSWLLTGNAGTDPATNFLGTTDGEDLIIQPDTGNVGVGTGSPTYKLDVNGNFRSELIDGDAEYKLIVDQGINTRSLYIPTGENSVFIQNNSGLNLSVLDTINGQGINHYTTANNYQVNNNNTTVFFQINRNNGNVGIGTATPAAIVDITSSTSGLLLSRVDTTERDAFTGATNGMIIYNTDTNKFQGYANNAWVDLN